MKRPLCLICLIFVLMVMLFEKLIFRSLEYKALPPDSSQTSFCGELTYVDEKNGKSVLYLKNHSSNLCCICYLAEAYSNVKQLKIGNVLCVEGKVSYFEESTNDGQFDMKKYYAVKGIDFSMLDCSYRIESERCRVLLQSLFAFKQYVGKIIDAELPSKDAGVLKAMLLGDKSDMDVDIKGLYQRAGIAHIVAVSGLHITMWGMGFCRLLRKLYMPLPMANALSFLFVVCYGQLTGSQASAVRSIIMFSLYLLAQILHRTYDLLTAMMLSATMLLLVQPLYASYGGFLLSFFAVAGMAIILPWLKEQFFQKKLTEQMVYTNSVWKICFLKIKSGVISSFLASLSVSVASLPIQIMLFQTYSVYSIIINILIAPLVGVLLFISAVSVICVLVFPPIGHVSFYICHLILFIFEKICSIFDTVPCAHPIIAKPGGIKIGLYYLFLVGIIFFSRKLVVAGRKGTAKYKAIAILLLTMNICVLCVHLRLFNTLYMLDVGQGDCFVLEEKSGMTIMIDGGSSSVSEVGKYRMVPFLKSHGINRLDYVFLSHADSDHTNGVLEMLKAFQYETIKIDHLLLTDYAKDNEAYKELIEAATEKGTEVVYIANGFHLQKNMCGIRCIYPGNCAKNQEQSTDVLIDAFVSEENDRSMVLQLKVQGTDILFVGDLTEEGEKRLISNHLLEKYKADILKVGHHGSKYSSSEAFLQQIKPKLSLISAGRNNRYGHPHGETIERIEDVGSNRITTSEIGMSEVRFDKKGFSVFCPYADESFHDGAMSDYIPTDADL